VSSKAIEVKQQQVEALTERFKEAKSVVIADYLGLTVEEVTELRVNLLNQGCEFNVIKNNIIRRAAKAAGYDDMLEHLIGPNAVAFSHEDAVSAAKVIHDFAKDHKKLELKVGVVDGEYMDNERIQIIATLPNREELLTMFAGGLLQPIKEVAIGLTMHAENLEKNA